MALDFESLPREIRAKIYKDMIDASGEPSIFHFGPDHVRFRIQCRPEGRADLNKTHSMLLVNRQLSREYLQAIASYPLHEFLINRSPTHGARPVFRFPKRSIQHVRRVSIFINTWCDHPDPWETDFEEDAYLTDDVIASAIAPYGEGEKEELLNRFVHFLQSFSNVNDLAVDWEGKDWEPGTDLRRIVPATKQLPRLRRFHVLAERKDSFMYVRVEAERRTADSEWTETWSQKYVPGPDDDEEERAEEVIAGPEDIRRTRDGENNKYERVFHDELVQLRSAYLVSLETTAVSGEAASNASTDEDITFRRTRTTSHDTVAGL